MLGVQGPLRTHCFSALVSIPDVWPRMISSYIKNNNVTFAQENSEQFDVCMLSYSAANRTVFTDRKRVARTHCTSRILIRRQQQSAILFTAWMYLVILSCSFTRCGVIFSLPVLHYHYHLQEHDFKVGGFGHFGNKTLPCT